MLSNFIRFIGLLTTALLVSGAVAQADSRVPKPDIPRGKGEQCVEPTDVMRRSHMEFILHQRDDTVHQGIRTTRHSLRECIACHAVEGPDGEFVNYKSEQHFCSTCHAYAAVHIDCFTCHASTPNQKTARGNPRQGTDPGAGANRNRSENSP